MLVGREIRLPRVPELPFVRDLTSYECLNDCSDPAQWVISRSDELSRRDAIRQKCSSNLREEKWARDKGVVVRVPQFHGDLSVRRRSVGIYLSLAKQSLEIRNPFSLSPRQ